MDSLTKNSLYISGVMAVTFIASIFLPNYFVYIVALQVVAIIAIWKLFLGVTWTRDVVIEKAKFLILPLVFNLGSLYFITVLFQDFVKVVFAILVVGANYYLWKSLRKVHNLSDRTAIFHRNVLIVISFMSIFFGSTVLFRLFMLFATASNRLFLQLILIILIYALFYGISFFLAWENGADEDVKKLRPYILVTSLLGAEVAWISSLWIVNYPVISTQEKASLGGTPLPAILLTIVFYFLWGLVFHKMDKSLTRRVLTEYFVLTVIFIAILLVTAKWLPNL
jgi:hypothetical protein